MKGMRKLSITATAMVAAAVMALAGCGSSNSSSSSSSSASTSGSAKSSKFVAWSAYGRKPAPLAYLGPAGTWPPIKLAVRKTSTTAGGVLGNKHRNHRRRRHLRRGPRRPEHLRRPIRPQPRTRPFIIGPAVQLRGQEHLQVRSPPQNVPMLSIGRHLGTAFSGLSDYFFRTVAPGYRAGRGHGPDLIAQDGVQKLAIAVFNDEYGTGPARHDRQNRIRRRRRRTSSMAKRTRSTRPKRTSHPSPPPSRPSNPDATLVIAFDQTEPLAQGARRRRSLNTKKLYFDGRQHRPTIPAELRRGPARRAPPAPFQVPTRPRNSSQERRSPLATT